MNFPFTQVDVFTPVPLLGNPLAVVHDADGLGAEAMQAFARWTQLSETAFLLRPTDPQADYRVRIFTPGGELPFAGHPTLGSCHAWLQAGGQPRSVGQVVQECGVGRVIVRRDETCGRLAFAAPPLRTEAVNGAVLPLVCAALGLAADAVQAARWLDNGPRWLGLQVDSAATLLALEPDHARLKAIGAKVALIAPHPGRGEGEGEGEGVGVGVGVGEGRDSDFEVRAFAAPIGIFEDPVTGSVNASLAQWLIERGAAPARYVAAQGSRLGRAGRVHIEHDGHTLWVGGSSVSLIRGTVAIG